MPTKGNSGGLRTARRARWGLGAICCMAMWWMIRMLKHAELQDELQDELWAKDGALHSNLRANPRAPAPPNSLWPNAADMPDGAEQLSAADIAAQRLTHIVFSTGCEKYHDWQSVGMFYSARRVTPYANVTRLLIQVHSRMHRGRSLQVHTQFAAFVEIYDICARLHRSIFKIF